MVPAFILLSILFSSVGLLFGYSVTIPIATQYLYDFNDSLGSNLWSLSFYIDYLFTLLLAHALVFEAAAVLLLLLHYGVITSRKLVEKRAHVYLFMAFIAALLTPPDVLTQLLLLTPMAILYEAIIFYGSFREKVLGLHRQKV